MTLTKVTDKIWTISEFLSGAECDELIMLSEHRGFEPADISLPAGATFMKSIRDNYRAHFTDSAFNSDIWTKLKPLLPELSDSDSCDAVGLFQNMRFYRYNVGQKFKRHIDGRVKQNGCISRLTFMIYLNDDYEGGETKFDDVTIHPETGMALLFIHEQKHEGLPLQAGTKYVLRSDVLYSYRGT